MEDDLDNGIGEEFSFETNTEDSLYQEDVSGVDDPLLGRQSEQDNGLGAAAEAFRRYRETLPHSDSEQEPNSPKTPEINPQGPSLESSPDSVPPEIVRAHGEGEWSKSYSSRGESIFNFQTGEMMSIDGKSQTKEIREKPVVGHATSQHEQVIKGWMESGGAAQFISFVEIKGNEIVTNVTSTWVESDGTVVSETWTKSVPKEPNTQGLGKEGLFDLYDYQDDDDYEFDELLVPEPNVSVSGISLVPDSFSARREINAGNTVADISFVSSEKNTSADLFFSDQSRKVAEKIEPKAYLPEFLQRSFVEQKEPSAEPKYYITPQKFLILSGNNEGERRELSAEEVSKQLNISQPEIEDGTGAIGLEELFGIYDYLEDESDTSSAKRAVSQDSKSFLKPAEALGIVLELDGISFPKIQERILDGSFEIVVDNGQVLESGPVSSGVLIESQPVKIKNPIIRKAKSVDFGELGLNAFEESIVDTERVDISGHEIPIDKDVLRNIQKSKKTAIKAPKEEVEILIDNEQLSPKDPSGPEPLKPKEAIFLSDEFEFKPELNEGLTLEVVPLSDISLQREVSEHLFAGADFLTAHKYEAKDLDIEEVVTGISLVVQRPVLVKQPVDNRKLKEVSLKPVVLEQVRIDIAEEDNEMVNNENVREALIKTEFDLNRREVAVKNPIVKKDEKLEGIRLVVDQDVPVAKIVVSNKATSRIAPVINRGSLESIDRRVFVPTSVTKEVNLGIKIDNIQLTEKLQGEYQPEQVVTTYGPSQVRRAELINQSAPKAKPQALKPQRLKQVNVSRRVQELQNLRNHELAPKLGGLNPVTAVPNNQSTENENSGLYLMPEFELAA